LSPLHCIPSAASKHNCCIPHLLVGHRTQQVREPQTALNTDCIDPVTLIGEKVPLYRRFMSFRSAIAICGLRAIKPSQRAITATRPPARKSCKTLHYGRCGRCGRYFETFVRDTVLLAEASSMTRAFQSRLERVCSRGEGSWGLRDLTGSTNLQNGFYAHLGQADRASGSRPGCDLLLPLPCPSGFASRSPTVRLTRGPEASVW
jgi:hypothetical protein